MPVLNPGYDQDSWIFFSFLLFVRAASCSFSCKIAVDKLFAAPKHSTLQTWHLGLVFLQQWDEGPGHRRGGGGKRGPQAGSQPACCANTRRTEIGGGPIQEGQTLKNPRTEADCFAQQCLRSGAPNPSQFSHQEVKEFLQSVNTESVFCSTEHRFHRAGSKMIG